MNNIRVSDFDDNVKKEPRPTLEEKPNTELIDYKKHLEIRFKEAQQDIQAIRTKTPEEINNRIEELFGMKVCENKSYSSEIDIDVLNALNRMSFFENREKNDIIEKALIKYIPKKYYED